MRNEFCFEIVEWWDVSTSSDYRTEGNYRIEERSIGLFATKTLAINKVKELENGRKNFKIFKRKIKGEIK